MTSRSSVGCEVCCSWPTCFCCAFRAKRLLPKLPREVDAVVFALGEGERGAAIRTARSLRARGLRVELVLGSPRLKRVMSDADRAGATEVWLLGPDELERGAATVRNLATGEQREEKLPD